MLDETKPAVICFKHIARVTKTIKDEELFLDEYRCLRCDSFSRHTGGNLMYIKEGVQIQN